MKTQILAAIGETVLQPAARLNAALAANDRIKYAFSLLQMALSYAEHPEQAAATMKQERIACGIDDPDLDTAVAGARMVGKSCHVPAPHEIMSRIADDIRLMAAPVLTTNPEGLAARLDLLLKALPAANNDLLDPDTISAMMQAGHDRPDSLHRLVMDLHKQLNAMQAELAEETRGRRRSLQSRRGRPSVGLGLYDRAESYGEAEIQPSGPGHHGNPRRRSAGDPERHRHHGRACDRDPCARARR